MALLTTASALVAPRPLTARPRRPTPKATMQMGLKDTIGNIFVPPEPKVAVVIRIRGIIGVGPKVRKILQLLRLRQIHNAVFVKLNRSTINMLRLVEPYVAYGVPQREDGQGPDLQARLRQGQCVLSFVQMSSHPSTFPGLLLSKNLRSRLRWKCNLRSRLRSNMR